MRKRIPSTKNPSEFFHSSGQYRPHWLKDELAAHGISQGQLARRIGMSTAYVSSVLNGARRGSGERVLRGALLLLANKPTPPIEQRVLGRLGMGNGCGL
jgi:hypothetical protein